MKTLLDQQYKEDVVRRLGQLQVDSPRRWGRMNAHQMICHLSDSFRAILGEKDASPASNLFSRTLMKWVALRVPLPWPHGVKTRPEIDQTIGGTAPIEFERDRQELLLLLERFVTAAAALRARVHPIFGPLSDVEWMRWAYLHCDHHLRQFGA